MSSVTPAEAGVQDKIESPIETPLDSRLRGNDSDVATTSSLCSTFALLGRRVLAPLLEERGDCPLRGNDTTILETSWYRDVVK